MPLIAYLQRPHQTYSTPPKEDFKFKLENPTKRRLQIQSITNQKGCEYLNELNLIFLYNFDHQSYQFNFYFAEVQNVLLIVINKGFANKRLLTVLLLIIGIYK